MVECCSSGSQRLLTGELLELGFVRRTNNVDLSLDTRHENGHTIIEVGGEIDVYTAPKLRDRISELVADGNYKLVIDMENVDFLDSTGLGVLVGGLKKLRAHDGSMQLICTQERLLKIFRITQLAKVFAIYDTQADALAAK
jgi:anti-sigma B factor antagonist